MSTITDSFLEEYPYPILRLDFEGKIIYANPASLPVLLEWEKEVGDIVNEELLTLLNEIVNENIAHKTEVQSGSSIIELNLFMSNKFKFINVFGQDITIQKALEKEKEEKLLQESKEAIEINRTKARALANLSHEIRTPLNGIIGLCNLMRNEDLTPSLNKKVKLIENCSQMLGSLINSFLDFSKIEAGKIILEDIPFDIHETCFELVNIMESRASEKNISISYNQGIDVPQFILGDITKIRQVLLNLINNAIKFTDHGSITISSRSEKINGNKLLMQISVKDTGIGISKKNLTKIFQPFSQADVSTTRRYGGTGLGLTISKSIAEIMKGDLWVESTPNLGSTFHFKFETQLANRKHTDQTEKNNIAITKAQEIGKLDILLVEDNSVNQIVAAGILEKLGQHPDIVNNGLEAIEKLKIKNYDLIFMDCLMPALDGYETAKKIHKEFPQSNIPMIIALTASISPENKEKCLASGMDGIIGKPIQPNEIAKTLTTCHLQKGKNEKRRIA